MSIAEKILEVIMKLKKYIFSIHVIAFLVALPILLFHAFYGDAGFDWDKNVKMIKRKIANH